MVNRAACAPTLAVRWLDLTVSTVLTCCLAAWALAGVASDPLHPPGEQECTDSWFSCTWQSLTSETEATDDLHISGLTDECLSQVSGSFIYQRHDDVVSPGLDSLLLYRPKDEHLWVVAPGRVAFASCFESMASYLHSVQDDCARSPVGKNCEGRWRQATPEGKWCDTNATVVALDDECADGEVEGDMCCGVNCANGIHCANEFRAGAWAGVCPNGTAQ